MDFAAEHSPDWESGEARIELLRLLRKPTGCSLLICGTCGGQLGAQRMAAAYEARYGAPLAHLAQLSISDLCQLGRGQTQMPALLARAARQRRLAHIVAQWVASPAFNAKAAVLVIRWTGELNALPFTLEIALAAAAQPLALASRLVREDIERSLPEAVGELAAYRRAFKLDRERDTRDAEMRRAMIREQEKRKAAAALEREAQISRLDALPFAERVVEIHADPALHQVYRPSWATVSEAELRSLSAGTIQALVPKLEAIHKWGDAWWPVLRRLRDLRHAQRLETMAAHRARLRHLPPVEQLSTLAHDPSIPVEHYPIELADYLNAAVLEVLEPAAQERLLAELARTRLRRWRIQALSAVLRSDHPSAR